MTTVSDGHLRGFHSHLEVTSHPITQSDTSMHKHNSDVTMLCRNQTDRKNNGESAHRQTEGGNCMLIKNN